jgi:GxxExxY protein
LELGVFAVKKRKVKTEKQEVSENDNRIGREVVDAAIKIHKTFGPGLLEKVYELCMEHELRSRGFKVVRQAPVHINFGDKTLEAFRLDLIVEDRIIIELKSIENYNKLWEAQIISHLKLSKLNLGYLLNFNVPLMKQGIKRFVNFSKEKQV